MDFFRHFSLFVFQIRPISLPRMRLFTDILFAVLASEREGIEDVLVVSSFPRIYGRGEWRRGVKEGEGG